MYRTNLVTDPPFVTECDFYTRENDGPLFIITDQGRTIKPFLHQYAVVPKEKLAKLLKKAGLESVNDI